MKKTLSFLSVVILSSSFALAEGPVQPPVAAPVAPGVAAPLPANANGMNEAPANPNWQNLDSGTAAVETGKKATKKRARAAHRHARAKKSRVAHKARKTARHARHHR